MSCHYLTFNLYQNKRNNRMLMINQHANRINHPYIIVLVFEFWLSGLWILSLIFTASDSEHLEHINFFMFITLGIASLLGGYASDLFGRVLVFKIASVIWAIGGLMILLDQQTGYVISAGSIGLLNNLTFVLIMEHFPAQKDLYTIYVLMGWASSQITLGVIFFFISIKNFYLLLFLLTLVYTISAFLYIEQDSHQNPHQNISQEIVQNPNQMQLNNLNKPWWKNVLPHSLCALFGGCVLMFVMQMFYYRTQFTLDRFGVSLQLNTIIVGCTQLIANIFFTKFINKYSRKTYLRMLLFILSLLFLVLVLFSNKITQTIIEGIMRLFDTCIMIILGVYLPQLFDINERGKGINYIMSFGVLGSALNSIILNNFQFWQLIFFLIVAFLSTFCFRQNPSSEQSTKKLLNEQK